MKKKVTNSKVEVNTYLVLEDCIERGLEFGWNHAHKHVDKPDKEKIIDCQFGEVMNAICEYFKFGDDE